MPLAVISIALVWLAYDEVWTSYLYLRRIWSETRDRRVLWAAFWGKWTAAGERIGDEFVRGFESGV